MNQDTILVHIALEVSTKLMARVMPDIHIGKNKVPNHELLVIPFSTQRWEMILLIKLRVDFLLKINKTSDYIHK
jgi:hypothetical protein